MKYKCPNICVFYCFYGFIWDFLQFPSEKSSNIFTAHRIQRDTNFKDEKSRVCKGSFFDIFIFIVFYRCKKKLALQVSLKTSSDESKIFTTNLPNFKEFHRRKLKEIHCQFWFLCCARLSRHQRAQMNAYTYTT